MEYALDGLLSLLEKILNGEIAYDEGVCLIFDHVYEIIMKLRSIHNFKGQIDYDALDVEFFCSVQDLVRGPPIVPSQIPFELQIFRTHIMGIIRKVTGAPSPPTLPPRCDGTKPVQWLATICEYFQFYDVSLVDRLNCVASMLEGSALAWFNWRMRGGLIDGWTDFVEKFKIRFAPLHDLYYICFEKTPKNVIDKFVQRVEDTTTLPTPTMKDALGATKLRTGPRGEDEVSSVFEAINEDNGKPNTVEVIDDDLKHADVAKNYKPDPTFQEFSISAGVVIVEYDIPKSVDKVTDADGKQAHSPMLIDTIKLFELVDVIKTEHLIPSRATTYVLRPVSSFHHFAPRSTMVEDSKNGLLLWFGILSPFLKHEWEPPP